LYYSEVYECDTLNGIGFRVSIFCSGCGKENKCKYCQNSKAWNFDYGKLYTSDTEKQILNALSKPYIDGISLLGGEITDNLEDGHIFDLLDIVKEKYPNKTIWCWTGYIYEDIINVPLKLKLLGYVDVLIDGEFIYEKKDLNVAWANSSNQRIINVPQSLQQNTIILYKGNI